MNERMGMFPKTILVGFLKTICVCHAFYLPELFWTWSHFFVDYYSLSSLREMFTEVIFCFNCTLVYCYYFAVILNEGVEFSVTGAVYAQPVPCVLLSSPWWRALSPENQCLSQSWVRVDFILSMCFSGDKCGVPQI